MKTARLKMGVCVILGLCLLGATASGAMAVSYPVFAFNDLGMHCMEPDYSTLVILPPFNVVHAQVLSKGAKPTLLDNSKAKVIYSAIADPTGSINTTSKGKTNFWQYVAKLFGVSLPVDVGLLGAKMPNATFGPQPLTFDNSTNNHWFTAAGIPITPWDDNHKFNPYPLMNIQAFTPGGTLLSSLSTVLPISTEQHCEVCHATGMDAASPGFHGVQNWSQNPNKVLQYKENILILHDALIGTRLYDATPPPNRKPAFCFTCHYSYALDVAKTGPNSTQLGNQFLSPAMHRHHGKAPAINNIIPIPDDGASTCYYCHPGKNTKCLRGVMAGAGLVCQDCHGGLLAVAGATPLANDGFRRPWIDLPKCQSCHRGDALKGMANGTPRRLVYDPADPAATPRTAANKRFAEENRKLFRFSRGHGMACEACHGSPHAEWPVRPAAGNDNLAARQIQGHPGPIIECQVCHGDALFPSLGGPHGLHNVGDSLWIARHNLFYASQPDQCQACHGLNLEGTRLSRAAAFRNLTSAMQNPVAIKRGTPISCSMCHQNPLTKF